MEDDYGDIGPIDRMAEANARDNAKKWEMQAKQLALQGRQVEANIANQKATIELRKAELAQQRYLTERSQQLQAGGMMAQLRGPGNAAQFIDAGRRLSSFGTQSGALAMIAAGGTPQGAFAPGASQKPISLQDRMSGNLGASEDAINQRDANDKRLAAAIASRSGQLQRGSIESLSPYEQQYLSSYVDAGGSDWDSVLNAYKSAGIHQGRTLR
jgi:hypothetical protein